MGHLATTVLSDGSLVTAYGSFLVDNGQVDQGRAATVLVKWDPSTATVLPLMDWGNNASGDWNSTENWAQSLAPQDKHSTAVFGTVIASAQTVFTDSAVTVRGVKFDNTQTYAVVGLGSVELDGDAGNATIDVLQGSHQFQVVVDLASNTDVAIAEFAVLSFNNALNLNGNDLVKTGLGEIKINNALNTGGGTASFAAGAVAGSGTITGDVVNLGATIAPGNSPGTLTIQGNYTQEADATLAIELAGLTQGSDYDLLNVSGIVTVNGGSLDVTLLEEFNPSEGDVFDILDASTIGGAGFDSLSLPGLADGLAWDISNLMSGGSLSISAVPEPSAILLVLSGALCAWGTTARRKRRS